MRDVLAAPRPTRASQTLSPVCPYMLGAKSAEFWHLSLSRASADVRSPCTGRCLPMALSPRVRGHAAVRVRHP